MHWKKAIFTLLFSFGFLFTTFWAEAMFPIGDSRWLILATICFVLVPCLYWKEIRSAASGHFAKLKNRVEAKEHPYGKHTFSDRHPFLSLLLWAPIVAFFALPVLSILFYILIFGGALWMWLFEPGEMTLMENFNELRDVFNSDSENKNN